MGLLTRITAVLNAKANEILDRYDDPREALDYAHELEAEQLQDVRSAFAAVNDTYHHLELECRLLGETAIGLEEKAFDAVRRGADDAAREALARKQVLAEGLAQLNGERAELSEEAEHFGEALTLLEQRVQALSSQKEAFKVQASESGSLQEVVATLMHETTSIKGAVRRARDRVAALHLQAQRIDNLLSSGALSNLSRDPAALAGELDRARSSDSVTRELLQIKGSVSTTARKPVT